MKKINRNGRTTILLGVLTGTVLILAILLFLFLKKKTKDRIQEKARKTGRRWKQSPRNPRRRKKQRPPRKVKLPRSRRTFPI